MNKLKVNEIFHSISGEGMSIGKSAWFIRLYGCNLKCSYCDTRYACEGDNYKEMTVPRIISKIPEESYVIITGGEPLIQDIDDLVYQLIYKKNCEVEIETNGSIDIVTTDTASAIFSVDFKLPSSGMMDKMIESHTMIDRDQIKFVISDETDYEKAVEVIQNYYTHDNVVFTPVGGTDLKWLVNKVIQDDRLPRNVKVLPQLHKIVGMK